VTRDIGDRVLLGTRTAAEANSTNRRAAALNVACDVRGRVELAGRDAVETQLNEMEVLEELLAALGFKTRGLAAIEAERLRVEDERHRRQRRPLERTARASTREVVAARTAVSLCGDRPGTERGYRRHLAAYQTPCGECLRWRTDQLNARWTRLGVDPTSEVVIPV
jgi:hypothetical protein